MKRLFIRSLIPAVIVTVSALVSFGQQGVGHTSGAGRMFVGESLKYEGKIDKYLRGMSVADLTFTVTSTPGSSELAIRSEAVSKGTLLKLFRFSFLQQYTSTIDLDNFRILKTTKHDVQKQRVRDSEALFDYRNQRVTFVETDPKDPMRPPRRIASEIGGEVHDIISAIYAVRLLPLAIGKRFEFRVSDSGLVYRVPLVITAREIKSTVFGKISCFRVEPEIFGPGRLIEQKGSMVIWMTEDERHVPVRAEVKSSLGKVNIQLKSYTRPGAVPGSRT